MLAVALARMIVSIHAPARGATTCPNWDPDPERVSIHAPARGATITFLEGFKDLGVSIHAPARGATNHGNDIVMMRLFQSTPPRGGRRQSPQGERDETRFNPRPRAGGDKGLQ